MPEEAERRAVPPHSNESHYAATRLYEPETCVTRQEEDIALAAELLQAGIVNEREIAAAVSDWSIHGNISLSDHLAKRGLLSVEQKNKPGQNYILILASDLPRIRFSRMAAREEKKRRDDTSSGSLSHP